MTYSSIYEQEAINFAHYDWKHLTSISNDLKIVVRCKFIKGVGSARTYHKSVWCKAYGLRVNP